MGARRITFEQAKAQYVHRFTMEYVPDWAKVTRSGGRDYYAPHYRTDREWYDNTIFPGEGHLHHNCKHAEATGQTWPLGQTLSKPFKGGSQ